MKCSFCNTDNPEGAAFCKHCGKSLTQDKVECPSCKNLCIPTAQFCPKCGTALKDDQPEPQPASQPASQPEIKPEPQSRGIGEKKQKTLSLVSGIIMMGAVFFALIFSFFIGAEYRVSGSSYYNSYETYTVWHYFGRAYSMLESDLAGHGYSAYTIAANYIPVVLSTLIAAATLGATVTFTLLATVKFGLHFKRPEVRYYKYAVAAVFSFMLGATLFDCIHSTSTQNDYASLSGTTIAGMVFCCLFIIASLVLRTISFGNRFKKKSAVLDCVCTLIGILFLAMVSGFADSPQADYTLLGSYRSSYSIGFFRLNNSLSLLYSAQSTVPDDFTAMFVFALLAILTQLAVQVLTFVMLIKRIGNYTEQRTFTLKTSIALAAVAAAYLIFSAIALEFANAVIPANYSELSRLWLAAAPIMTFVMSLLHLTVAITHRAVAKKENPEETTEEPEQADATI